MLRKEFAYFFEYYSKKLDHFQQYIKINGDDPVFLRKLIVSYVQNVKSHEDYDYLGSIETLSDCVNLEHAYINYLVTEDERPEIAAAQNRTAAHAAYNL